MRRHSMEEPPRMSIMLLGSTGSGKSASGNTIIGIRETFKEDISESVTRFCQSAETELDGQTITVIDTVGLSDTSAKIKKAETQIEKMLTLYSVDVFLLVIKLGETFTEENSKVVKWIQNKLSKLSNHTIVLFTHGDQLHEPIKKYLRECKTLRSIVDQCSGRYHVFNNKNEDRSQVTELLEKIESLRVMNAYKRYTEQDYKETQKALLLKKCAAGAAAAAVVVVVAMGVYLAVGGSLGASMMGTLTAGKAALGAKAEAGLAATLEAMRGYVEVRGAVAGGAGGAAGGAVAGVGGVAAGGGELEYMKQLKKMAASEAGGGRLRYEMNAGAVAGEVASMMGRAAVRGAVAVAGGVASMMGTAGPAALIGAALAAVAVGAGVYFLARKYISKEKDKSK